MNTLPLNSSNSTLTVDSLSILLTLNGRNYLPQLEDEIFSDERLLLLYVRTIFNRVFDLRGTTRSCILECIVRLAVHDNKRWNNAEAYFTLQLNTGIFHHRVYQWIDFYRSHFSLYIGTEGEFY